MTKRNMTSLYRFYSRGGTLLYVGITNNITRRVTQHDADKPWFEQAARIEVEHFDTRRQAQAREAAAIEVENPLYNIHHNRGREVADVEGRWEFANHGSGFTRQVDLWLYPELECSSILGEYIDLTPDQQFDTYVDFIQRKHPHWIERDAVPIVWCVAGPGVFEAAPIQAKNALGEDFLTHFTWPQDPRSGEYLDWLSLPVVNDRFPGFAEGLRWTPSPLQPTCPIASLMDSRTRSMGQRDRRRRIERDRRWSRRGEPGFLDVPENLVGDSPDDQAFGEGGGLPW